MPSPSKSWLMPGAYMDGANNVTGLNVLLGVAALYLALHQQTRFALGMVYITAILDHLDGYLARRYFFKDQTRRAFGKQLDTLADLVNFNIVPALCLTLLLDGYGAWLVASALVLCGCVRLAHFNITSDGAGHCSTGLPTTNAGFLIANLLMLFVAGHCPAGLVLALSA